MKRKVDPWLAPDRDDRPLPELFDAVAADAGERVFIHSRSLPDESASTARFVSDARAVARVLVARGVRPGDRVAILSENRPRWCLAFVGILYAGAVAVPLDPQLGPRAIANLLEDCSATAIFVSGELAERLYEVKRLGFECSTISLDPESPWEELLASAREVDLPELSGGETPAILIYTSGTTGSPKGVVLTHRNLRTETRAAAEAVGAQPDEVLLMFLPLQHVLAMVGTFLIPAGLGLRIVHANIQRGDELLAAVREENITILLGVPLLYQLMHERIMARLATLSTPARWAMRGLMGLSGWLRLNLGLNPGKLLFRSVHRTFGEALRVIVSGGDALSERVQRDFLALGFTLCQVYGLTETTGGATFTPPHAIVPGSVGVPISGVSVRIHEPDSNGSGEVCIKGPGVMAGYWNKPEASAAVLRDDWFHSGDLGRFDDEGRLFITGRLKNVIVLSSGKNIYPEELESHYLRCPSIKEMCVLSRKPRAGADRSEKLHAVIVPDWDRLKVDGIAVVRDYVRYELESASLELPSYQRVLSFELRRDPLARTATHKLQRHLIEPDEDTRPQAASAPDDAAAAARLESAAGQAVLAELTRRLGDDVVVRAHSNFELDLGLDSMNRLELLLGVERSLGVSISDEESTRVVTVDDLLMVLESRAGTVGAKPVAPAAEWQTLIRSARLEDLPASLRQPPTGLARWLVQGTVAVYRFVMGVFFELDVRGLEHLPADGRCIVCPNHVSFLDGPLLGASLPFHLGCKALIMGEADYIEKGVLGSLTRPFGVVPIDPNRGLRQSLKVGAAGLQAGRILCIFPEGVRSIDGRLGELKPGALILARELGAPIIPAVIEGTFEAWPRGQAWPSARPVRVTFGPPLDPAELLDGSETPEAAQGRLSNSLRQALVELGAPAD